MNTRQALITLMCLGLAGACFAQQAGLGSITGVVQDASGAVIPGAKVVVANESKGITRNLETNAEGIFSAPSLVPSGGYSRKGRSARILPRTSVKTLNCWSDNN